MTNSNTHDQQAKNLVLKLSAIISIAGLATAFAAKYVNFPPAYSYGVGALGLSGVLLHLLVRFNVLKPQLLDMESNQSSATRKTKPFWLDKMLGKKHSK